MRFYLLPIAAAVFFSQQLPAANEKKVSERLDESAIVLSEIMNANDKGIPEDLLEKAHCAVIVPGMKKGAFIVGGSYGKGFLTCRKTGGWSAPASIRIEGGSVGFQIGGSETDVVMLVMNERGAQKLMQSQFTLGGEGEVAAGPGWPNCNRSDRCKNDGGNFRMVAYQRRFCRHRTQGSNTSP